MNKWTKTAIFLSSALFIAGNLYLTEKKDSKIDKLERIEEWNKVQIGNLSNTLHKPGVIIPSEDYPIYFDQEIGAFKQFLVKPGEEVTDGTPLFEYSPYNIEQEIERLETERTELENKISSLKNHIDQLESLSVQAQGETADEQSILDSFYNIEKEIYQKELEKQLVEDELSKLDELLDGQKGRMDILTAASEVEGYVKEINTDISNPVITISSNIPALKGTLSETEVRKISEGMEVSVSSFAQKEKITGEVAQISPLPKEEPDLDKETLYPFTVELDSDEIDEDLLSGHHVNMDIIMKKTTDAFLIKGKSVHKEKSGSFTYVITSEGTIEKREIKPGIKDSGKQEVLKGLSEDEIVVASAKDVQYKTDSYFTTPLKFKELTKKQVKKSFKTDWKYLLRGFLSR